MPKLEESLKELKRIKPETEFARNTRLSILSTSPTETYPFSWKGWFLGVVEYGAAMALVVLLLALVAGKTPLGSILAPFQSGSLNNNGLRAEAEAIDIQIRLFDLDYAESSSTTDTLSTPSTTPSLQKQKVLKKLIKPSSQPEKNEGTEIATSSPTTIDEALDLLTK